MTPGTRRGTRKPGEILRELEALAKNTYCNRHCSGWGKGWRAVHDNRWCIGRELRELLRELRQSLGPYQKGRGR